MAFKNFPFVTDAEVEALLADKPLTQLEYCLALNKNKFSFYQKSPFYKGNTEQHIAHLTTFDTIVKKCEEKIQLLKGGQNG